MDFRLKAQMRQGASCTITSAQISSHTEDDGDGGSTTSYDLRIGLTLQTPDGKHYNATDYDAPSFTSQNDARTTLSYYQVNHTYVCWYDPDNLTVAMFFKPGPGNYAGLAGWLCVFLLFGVLPNGLLMRALGRTFVRRLR